jgi:hypothetical protein
MNHLVAKNTGGDPLNLGWPAGQERYFLYSLALSCAGGLALWNGLSIAQKIAQSQPLPRPGTFQLRSCGGGTDPVDPGTPTDELEEDIVFTGQNVSDAPSTNPAVMSVAFTYIGNGENTAKVSWTQTPADGKSLRIVFNTMGYMSVAEIEARTYFCGEDNLFQGYHMSGNGDDNQRSDSTPNATQIIHVK